LRAELLLRRNPDGGWSLGPELESTPLDSALAVLALTGHGDVPAPVLDAAGWYLAATQSPGGGWRYPRPTIPPTCSRAWSRARVSGT
ncbi:MAG: hypothetical protein GY856_40080, partial [bacterium]|nr:hypothetical protein [bacterium]